MSILNVVNLSHGFGDRAIFTDVSFRLLKGEHVGFIGANGEGKSTFMNIITGSLMPDEGKIEWEKSQEYRLSVKLKNASCQKCSIAPICGGGCSRYILEKEEKPYCLFNYDNKAIDKFIINHVEKMLMKDRINL